MDDKIKLGQKVKDIVSGISGIAVSRTEFLNGCIRYTVQTKKTTKAESFTFEADWEQLEVVNDGIIKKRKKTNTGGLKNFSKKIIG
jgi:hypothetical protein